MIERLFWRQKLEDSWQKASVVWLTGVRRVGKTVLALSLKNARYLNCDLPSVRLQLEDYELFLKNAAEETLLFDEIHRLPDPSSLLKVAADEFPSKRILATGSSTLDATTKFRDSLAGRKRTVTLQPTLYRELAYFGVGDIGQRLLHGGLPQRALNAAPDPTFYSEWIDSFFARDIQELFAIAKRQEFLALVETMLRQSGGQLAIASLARDCRLSRPSALNYLQALETTHLVRALRPYHSGGTQELVKQPKYYAFDTGFVCHARGWDSLRPDDVGELWEHLVLDELLASGKYPRICYWRNKSGREVDFVAKSGRDNCDAFECKWNPAKFSPRNLQAFRDLHPSGENYLVCPNIDQPYITKYDKLQVRVISPDQL